jgi:L-alanine-DL-glutamate epimerase-like enolase superfamily enzyme
VRVEGYELRPLQADVSSEFTRKSTVIVMHGGGHEGVGEDVSYDAVDQEALQAGAIQPLAGEHTIASLSERLAGLDLFPSTPQREVSRLYRVWAYESAALDLALRQAGESLHARLGRQAAPVRFVVSLRLGEPPRLDHVRRLLQGYPTLRFKLDPTSSWSDALVAELAELDVVDTLDLKGLYEGSVVDQGPDAELYRRVAEGLPGAWLEDPALTEETRAALAGQEDRITWDANLHGPGDLDTLAFPPRTVNVKPSRLGGLRSLLDTYDLLAERGIGAYGGGQFELGPGRGQIQYLASLFHPDAPNDVAPAGFNLPESPAGLPSSPLPPSPSPTGFRWLGSD